MMAKSSSIRSSPTSSERRNHKTKRSYQTLWSHTSPSATCRPTSENSWSTSSTSAKWKKLTIWWGKETTPVASLSSMKEKWMSKSTVRSGKESTLLTEGSDNSLFFSMPPDQPQSKLRPPTSYDTSTEWHSGRLSRKSSHLVTIKTKLSLISQVFSASCQMGKDRL